MHCQKKRDRERERGRETGLTEDRVTRTHVFIERFRTQLLIGIMSESCVSYFNLENKTSIECCLFMHWWERERPDGAESNELTRRAAAAAAADFHSVSLSKTDVRRPPGGGELWSGGHTGIWYSDGWPKSPILFLKRNRRVVRRHVSFPTVGDRVQVQRSLVSLIFFRRDFRIIIIIF